MDLADFLNVAGAEPALRSLIIGGYAVAAHGHTRATFDVDLLVRRADRETWLSRLTTAGLEVFGQTAAFAQLSSSSGGTGLDLMFVDASTFERMWEMSETRDFGGVVVRVPALDHLLALKLHALKHASPHRIAKDAEDVEMLARRHGLNLRDARYEQLFLKYGTRELYEHFLRLLQSI